MTMHIHHIDGNPRNNEIANVLVVDDMGRGVEGQRYFHKLIDLTRDMFPELSKREQVRMVMRIINIVKEEQPREPDRVQ